jgi:hypothetical protein
MLALRPSCEHCDTSLPPDAREARVCTYECTFCAECVTTVLSGICPNCGGNFVPRPIRPAALLGLHPASTERVHAPVDLDAHAARVADLTSSGAFDPGR